MAKIRFSSTSRIWEIYLWCFIALLVGGRPFFFAVILGEYRYNDFYLKYYTDILFAILVFIFPFLFKLIFSALPFEYVRDKRRDGILHDNLLDKNIIREKSISNYNLITDAINHKNIHINTEQSSTDKEEILLEVFLSKSRQIAEKLYSRSGVYLLIGCLIAFAGVLFFYFQTTTLHNALTPILKEIDTSRILFEYLPRIGTLIFVEAIAFFFLKQYRVTMEEYRYYEAIKRQRENQLMTFNYFKDYNNKPELFEKLISALNFGDNPNKLAAGDTTTFIETEKLNNKEIDFTEKLLEFIKSYKR
ncbi:MAG: hypothetical protein JSS96_03825 [Bacteroidetes bacterium]|nr:hypothetical protein [Bacteroidota bacterium]